MVWLFIVSSYVELYNLSLVYGRIAWCTQAARAWCMITSYSDTMSGLHSSWLNCTTTCMATTHAMTSTSRSPLTTTPKSLSCVASGRVVKKYQCLRARPSPLSDAARRRLLVKLGAAPESPSSLQLPGTESSVPTEITHKLSPRGMLRLNC